MGKRARYSREVTAYIVVYRDVWKIWGGFLDSNCKYGCGILAKIINMNPIFAIFRLKKYIWVLNLTEIINMGLKFSLSG